MTIVHQACCETLREQRLITFWDNPASNELPFLKDFPSEFGHIIGLHEPPSSFDKRGESNNE